jgi:BirA family biotin operon repressor/biotin-[acetyl-CoA-carboxylase] ligase
VIADLAELPARLAEAGARWIGRELVLVDETASTNDDAMARARAGGEHGLVVIADTQSKGRGRQGHVWHSPPGENLYLSVLLRLDVAPMRVPPLTLAAGVAVSDCVNALGVRASLKWPNDVLCERDGSYRKLAGILTEMSTRGMRADAIIVGIGMNVNTAEFPAELPHATSLRREADRGFDRAEVAAQLLAALEARVDRFVSEPTGRLAEAWRERSHIWGRTLRVAADGAMIEGVARDLDDDGALVLETAGGARVRVIAGEVQPS